MNFSFSVVNHSTASSYLDSYYSHNYAPYVVTFLFACAFLGIVSNALVLVAHKKDPLNCFQNTSTYFIHHIAICDFLSAIGIIPMVVLAVLSDGPLFFKSQYSPFLEPFYIFLGTFSILASTGLALERLTSVAFPLHYKVHATKRNIRFCIGALWITAMAVNGTHILLRYLAHRQDFFVEFVMASVSLGVTFGCYVACFVSIKRQQKAFKKGQMPDLTRRALQLKLSNERRFLATIFAVSLLAMVSWTPCVIMMMPSLNLEMKLSAMTYKVVSNVVVVLFMGNGIFGPFLYVWRLPKYRKTFEKLYCSLFR